MHQDAAVDFEFHVMICQGNHPMDDQPPHLGGVTGSGACDPGWTECSVAKGNGREDGIPTS